MDAVAQIKEETASLKKQFLAFMPESALNGLRDQMEKDKLRQALYVAEQSCSDELGILDAWVTDGQIAAACYDTVLEAQMTVIEVEWEKMKIKKYESVEGCLRLHHDRNENVSKAWNKKYKDLDEEIVLLKGVFKEVQDDMKSMKKHRGVVINKAGFLKKQATLNEGAEKIAGLEKERDNCTAIVKRLENERDEMNGKCSRMLESLKKNDLEKLTTLVNAHLKDWKTCHGLLEVKQEVEEEQEEEEEEEHEEEEVEHENPEEDEEESESESIKLPTDIE